MAFCVGGYSERVTEPSCSGEPFEKARVWNDGRRKSFHTLYLLSGDNRGNGRILEPRAVGVELLSDLRRLRHVNTYKDTGNVLASWTFYARYDVI